MAVRMTDAAAAYEEMNITFGEIAARVDGQWHVVTSTPQTINLIEWNNGASVEIGRAEMPAGECSEMRMVITKADVVIDGQTHVMTVSNEAQSGLRVGSDFSVQADATTDIVIDFDAARSVVETSVQGTSQFSLRPTVRAVPLALSGAIRGTVLNPVNGAIAFAIASNDTVTSSVVGSQGAYTLAFLPPGTYRVAVSDSVGASASLESVTVITGSITAVGNVTLQVF
jgi:hypothetical protein